MKERFLLDVSAVESELCTLADGMRGLGFAMTTIAEEGDGLSVSMNHGQQMGYLMTSLGNYCLRLSADLDAAVTSFNGGPEQQS